MELVQKETLELAIDVFHSSDPFGPAPHSSTISARFPSEVLHDQTTRRADPERKRVVELPVLAAQPSMRVEAFTVFVKWRMPLMLLPVNPDTDTRTGAPCREDEPSATLTHICSTQSKSLVVLQRWIIMVWQFCRADFTVVNSREQADAAIITLLNTILLYEFIALWRVSVCTV